jgi:NADH dehydrogenase
LADRLGSRGQIRLIEVGSQILSGFAPSSREAAQAALAQRRVQVELQTKVLGIEALGENGAPPFRLQLQRLAAQEMATDLVDGVLWTVGTRPAAVIANLDLPKTERGRLQVLPTLQTPTFPEIFALGDAAAVLDASGQPVPATAQAAFQQAGYCAWNLWALLTQERPLLPFRYFSLGEMLSLGVDAAVVSTLAGLTLSGPLGYLARRAAYLVRLPTLEHQLKVGWNWIARPLWQALGSL